MPAERRTRRSAPRNGRHRPGLPSRGRGRTASARGRRRTGYAKVMKSVRESSDWGSSAASAKCSGEKISDCGSAILRPAPRTGSGSRTATSPWANGRRQNCNFRLETAPLASHGMVDGAGQAHGHDKHGECRGEKAHREHETCLHAKFLHAKLKRPANHLVLTTRKRSMS